MIEVVLHLLGTAPFGFADRAAHRFRHGVAIQDGLAVDIARRPADGLDQRALGTQETLFVGIEDRHQRHFRNIKPFAQQVDAHQYIE